MGRDFVADLERIETSLKVFEELNLWNTDKYGSMEKYCRNIFISALIWFIAVDEIVMPEEVDMLNSAFGFNYQYADVMDICLDMTEKLQEFLDKPCEMFEMISKISSRISGEFKSVLTDACELIIRSDGNIAVQEKKGINQFVDKLKNT